MPLTKPMQCPKCGCWVKFTYFDMTGQHWICPECGNSSENQKYIYSTTTKPEVELMNNYYTLATPVIAMWRELYL